MTFRYGAYTDLSAAAADLESRLRVPGEGRSTSDLATYLLNNAVWNIRDFGASPTASVAVNSAAILAAMAAASSAGGGIVKGRGTFNATEITFAGCSNVMLEGDGNGANYDGNELPSFRLNVTSGVFATRLPPTSFYCGMRRMALMSNGQLSDTAPHPVITAGTEYGIVTETAATTIDQVVVIGFQHGCVIACGGNSNVFNQCTFVFNTKTGFAVTSGGSYAFVHPNLVKPVSTPGTTAFTVRDCAIRRNGWGMIIRDGTGIYDRPVVESNFFGGVYIYVGQADDAVSGTWRDAHLENNFSNYDVAVAYTITQNNLLRESAIAFIPWTLNPASTALNDPGYQLYMGSYLATSTSGPAAQVFDRLALFPQDAGGQCPTPAKAMYLKSCYSTKFYDCSSNGGDHTIVGTKNNAVRLGDGTGTWTANATHFYDYRGALPTDLGNRGCRFDIEPSLPGGGLTATGGYFRGLYGNLQFPAAQVASTDPNCLDDYEEGAWTPSDTSGAGLVFVAPSGTYTKTGRAVHLWATLQFPATADATSVTIGGVPFVAANNTPGSIVSDQGNTVYPHIAGSAISLEKVTGADFKNSDLSGKTITMSITHIV